MIFARYTGGTSTSHDERIEAETHDDLAVFPFATPLIAGPAAMGATVLLMTDAGDIILHKIIILVSLAVVLGLTLVALLLANHLHRWLGLTGSNVITRVLGAILTALAVQFIFDGLADSTLFDN